MVNGRGRASQRSETSIARGSIPLDEALPIAKQIVEALDAAHERGIVHRDLKPANIKVRADGTVEVLDFGLARALEPAGITLDMASAPTITSPAMTAMGMILGTAAYMSPEQARSRVCTRHAPRFSTSAERDGLEEVTSVRSIEAHPSWPYFHRRGTAATASSSVLARKPPD